MTTMTLLFAAALAVNATNKFDLAIDNDVCAWRTSESKIRGQAKKALARNVRPVTEKKILPPSGDRHDYMSMGPYWWPDPTKSDGKPYIRRDGEFNPERRDTDATRLEEVTHDAVWLASAALRFGDAAKGREAARRVRVFFLDEATRMNPNLNFAQSIPGRCDGRGIGIIDTYGFVAGGFLDALKILHGLGHLDDRDFAGMQDWFAKYLDWLETSKNGIDESKARNNHGTAYDVQRIAYADFCGKRDHAREILEQAKTRRLDGKFADDGSQPLETARTKGIGYSMYQIGMFCDLAYYGERYGVDVWHHVTPNGITIAKAIEFMKPYCFKEKPWPYKQIEPFTPSIFNRAKTAMEHFDGE